MAWSIKEKSISPLFFFNIAEPSGALFRDGE